jgi:hypothetical protein
VDIRTICLVVFVGLLSLSVALDIGSHLANVIAGIAGLVWCVLTVVSASNAR